MKTYLLLVDGRAILLVALLPSIWSVHLPSSWRMAEWTKATVLKTVVGLGSPRVRIPLPPP